MHGFWVTGIVAAMAYTSPVAAADVATLNGVHNEMPVPVDAEIVTATQALVDGCTPKASPEMRAALSDAARKCAARHGWSNAARDAAQTYALAIVSFDSVRPIAVARGANLDNLAL